MKFYQEVIPERIEDIIIQLDVSGAEANRYRDAIKALGGAYPNCQDQDLYKITYRFCATYYGNIARNLMTLEYLLMEADIEKVTITEINYARSLILDVAARLENVKCLINTRNKATPAVSAWRRPLRWLATKVGWATP